MKWGGAGETEDHRLKTADRRLKTTDGRRKTEDNYETGEKHEKGFGRG